MIAVIPVEGLIHVYDGATPPSFSREDAERMTVVKVNLALDGKPVGSVTFAVNAGSTNPRATEATYLLTGSYVRVQGPAIFDVLDPWFLDELVAAL